MIACSIFIRTNDRWADVVCHFCFLTEYDFSSRCELKSMYLAVVEQIPLKISTVAAIDLFHDSVKSHKSIQLTFWAYQAKHYTRNTIINLRFNETNSLPLFSWSVILNANWCALSKVNWARCSYAWSFVNQIFTHAVFAFDFVAPLNAIGIFSH